MRASPLVLVFSLALALPAAATAGDDPAARADDLARRLLAPDPAVREGAERDTAAAPADALRLVVRLLRDRAMGPAPSVERDPFVGADIPPMERPPDDTTRGVEFKVRYLLLEPDLAAKWLGAPTGASGAVVVPVPDANADRLLGGKDGRPSRSVTSAGMVAFDGQNVYSQMTNQTAYIADYDVRGSGTSKVADPIIGSVSEGFHLGLRGRRRAEGGFHVEVDARGGTVLRPIPAVEVAMGGAIAPVRIQAPTTTAFRSRTATDVAEGGSFLLGELGRTQDGVNVVAVLVTVRGVDFSKLAPTSPAAPPSPK
jgi:hypothetical protein